MDCIRKNLLSQQNARKYKEMDPVKRQGLISKLNNRMSCHCHALSPSNKTLLAKQAICYKEMDVQSEKH